MLAMVSAGLGTAHLLSDPNWAWLADQMGHRDWAGCTFWDLIQPSFMFIVGVAMPFAFARRRQQGEGWLRQFGHVLKRALLLVLIGVFLDSYNSDAPTIQMIRVLQQIAIGYVLAFFVLHLGPRVQAVTALLLLVAHATAFYLYGQAMEVDPWAKDVNVGTFVDQELHTHLTAWVNQLSEWLVGGPSGISVMPLSRGGYVTLNAVSAAATILFGVLCGELFLGPWSGLRKLTVLLLAGLGGLALGVALDPTTVGLSVNPLVPMVKRIWTASFAVYAAGWTCLMMALFYAVMDLLRWRAWAFPFVVVGMNSIAIYVVAQICKPLIRNGLRPFATGPFSHVPELAPVLMALLVLLVIWLFCFWLYRHRIFFKV
jgi:predicted acyltransferase